MAKRAGDRDTLAHSAGELVNVAVLKFSQMHQAQIVLRLLAALGFGQAFHLHAEFDVLPDREPGKQSVLLEDQDAVGARALNGIAIHQDLAGGWSLQAGNQVQQSGFAAAGGADNAEKFSRANVEIDAVESLQPLARLRAITKQIR